LTLLGALHRDGADPIEVLGDLAEAIHQTTRVKVAGPTGLGDAYPEEERRRAQALAGRLSLAYLSRAWQMLVRGIDEAGRAPSTTAAAEMVVIRLAHVSDLPSPDDVIRIIGGQSSARPRGSVGAGETAPAGTDRAAPTSSVSARVDSDDDIPFTPSENPRGDDIEADLGDGLDDPTDGTPLAAAPVEITTFEDVLELISRHRDVKLKVHLEENTSLVKFDPAGSIELHLLAHAPKELANELREKLNIWSGRRWMVALSRQPGARPIAEIRREREAAERAKLEGHPAVRAILDGFPDTRITEIRPLKREPDEDAAAS
ncbi:MAG TPA: DNA polymerase III subunit gamma/tau, partial [Hyphomicrobiaceae bacterium]|nr:DNA polymerase III subunit gamma/tau [Hyphomicrobiaceae bacterium]